MKSSRNGSKMSCVQPTVKKRRFSFSGLVQNSGLILKLLSYLLLLMKSISYKNDNGTLSEQQGAKRATIKIVAERPTRSEATMLRNNSRRFATRRRYCSSIRSSCVTQRFVFVLTARSLRSLAYVHAVEDAEVDRPLE